MKESTVYQSILEEGIEKGRSEGRSEGRTEGRLDGERRLLLLVGVRRLGEPDARTTAAIDAITSPERLEQLATRVLDVESWQDLLA